MLEITGVVDAALRPIGVRPIVVGGLAVAYWTTGLYLTGDIDVVMPHSTGIEQRLAALGFERDGRFWTLPGRDPVLEAPGSTLELNPNGYVEVELASGRTIRVQDVEEVLLLRLAEFVATGNADVFQQCLWLLRASGLDLDRFEQGPEKSRSPALSMLWIGPRRVLSTTRRGSRSGRSPTWRRHSVDQARRSERQALRFRCEHALPYLCAMACRPRGECGVDKTCRSGAARVRAAPTTGSEGGRAPPATRHA